MISGLYFDYAAATPVDERVLAAMQPFFSDDFYNPSAQYMAAKKTRESLEQARAKVANVLGAKPSEIIFTAGGTEGDNLAVHGVMQHFPDTNLVVSAIEHDAVLEAAKRYPYRIVPVKADGRVDITKLESLIDGRTVLVSIMLANNEIGTIQPLKEVKRVLDRIRKKRSHQDNPLPLYFHTDACQAAGLLDIHVSRLGVDMMTINGGKMYGPKQSGVLYVDSYVRLTPLIDGGGQERGLRSGTENVAGAAGLATALDLAQQAKETEHKRLTDLQQLFFQELETKIPNVIINGSQDYRLPNNVHFTVPGIDNERVLYALDEKGIQAAAGSACSAASTEPSHVLTALGVSNENARSSLRFSLGRHTTEDSIHEAIQALTEVIA